MSTTDVRIAGLGIGGSMALLSRVRLYRAGTLSAFFGSIFLGFYSVSMLVTADWAHGSAMGNTLIGSFAAVLLVVAPILFTFGVVSWQKSKSS